MGARNLGLAQATQQCFSAKQTNPIQQTTGTQWGRGLERRTTTLWEIWALQIKLTEEMPWHCGPWQMCKQRVIQVLPGWSNACPPLLPMGAHVSAAALEKPLEGLRPLLMPQDQQFHLQVWEMCGQQSEHRYSKPRPVPCPSSFPRRLFRHPPQEPARSRKLAPQAPSNFVSAWILFHVTVSTWSWRF